MSRFSSCRGAFLWMAIASVPLFVLFTLQWWSLTRFEVATARVLQQGSGRAAEAIAQQIQRDFKSPVFNLLEQIDHGDVSNLRFDKVAQTLQARARQFPLIDRFFIWSGRQDRRRAGGESDAAEVWFFAMRPAAADSPRVVDDDGQHGFFRDPALSLLIRADVDRLSAYRSLFAFSHHTYQDRSYHLVYHLLYLTPDRPAVWAFLGYLTESDHLRQHYFADVIARTNANAAALPGLPALAVSVLDDEGREIYRSGRALLAQYDGEARFPFLFFDIDLIESLSPFRPQVRHWTVRTGYDPMGIETIVRSETRPHRWVWLLVAFVALAGMVLTFRATAREIRLSKMKSEFFSNVSHELKTPLAKIQLFADTLASGRAKTPEKAVEYYGVISGQARKLGQLIGAMLDFGKIEAGVREYHMEEIDLCAVVESTLQEFGSELVHNGFRLDLELPPNEVPVLGNSEGLQQLVGNLLSNAVKYSPVERYLRVRLTTESGHALVEVTDRGIGIAHDEQRRIFSKFYRTSAARALAVAGSGVGLAIVDHVARAHGGKVSVTSVPGKGSTFGVSLPLSDEAKEDTCEAHPDH